jgi:hypothetical protein
LPAIPQQPAVGVEAEGGVLVAVRLGEHLQAGQARRLPTVVRGGQQHPRQRRGRSRHHGGVLVPG